MSARCRPLDSRGGHIFCGFLPLASVIIKKTVRRGSGKPRDGKMTIRKIGALLLTLSMALCLCACAEEEPNAGKYICTGASALGVESRVEMLFPKGALLELGSGGKGRITLNGESGTLSWSLDGGALRIETGGTVSSGRLENGIIDLALPGGVTLHFEKEEAAAPAESTAPAIPFEGDLYGWWSVENGEGQWSAMDGLWYDCCAELCADGAGGALLRFWDEDGSREKPMAEVNFSIDGNGVLTSLGGYFWQSDIQAGEWILDPERSPFEDMLCLENGRYQGAEGSYDYRFYLRPWGRSWDDVEAAEPEMLPYFYDDWYLPLADSGAPMPDEIAPDED